MQVPVECSDNDLERLNFIPRSGNLRRRVAKRWFMLKNALHRVQYGQLHRSVVAAGYAGPKSH
jgi:hypothetical protein